MAAKDRMKKRRQRILKNGGKTLSVLIDKDTVVQLKQLKSHFQESQAALVVRAINNLYRSVQVPDLPDDQSQQNILSEVQSAIPGANEKASKPNSDELLMKVILGK
jgi:hypothetical protein